MVLGGAGREVEVVTEAWIVAVVSAALALLLEVIPGLRKRWEALTWEAKRFAWLVGCVIMGATPFVLGCLTGHFGIEVGGATFVGSCTVDTLARGMEVGAIAYFASQATHGTVHGVMQVAKVKKGVLTDG